MRAPKPKPIERGVVTDLNPHLTIERFFAAGQYGGRAVIVGSKIDPVMWVFKLGEKYIMTDQSAPDGEDPGLLVALKPTQTVGSALRLGLALQNRTNKRGRPRKRPEVTFGVGPSPVEVERLQKNRNLWATAQLGRPYAVSDDERLRFELAMVGWTGVIPWEMSDDESDC